MSGANPNPQYLDVDTWHRRSAYDFFRGFDTPEDWLQGRATDMLAGKA
jgi:hypothetical protein